MFSAIFAHCSGLRKVGVGAEMIVMTKERYEEGGGGAGSWGVEEKATTR